VVVLHSELGSAPAIARALDRLEHPKVVGTLAGDDTVLVIARDAKDARSLVRELGGMMP
jgi:transcriptional regulator of arginine metabolism